MTGQYGVSRFKQDDVYLLKFGQQIRCTTKSKFEQETEASCELQITVRETSDTAVYFSIDSLGLVGGNVPVDDSRNSGHISARSLDGRLSLELTSENDSTEEWKLNAEMQVDLIYRLIEEELGFEAFDGDQFVSDTESFTGVLSGEAQTREAESASGYIRILAGDFVLKYQEGGLGEIESIVLPLAGRSFTQVSGQGEGPPPDSSVVHPEEGPPSLAAFMAWDAAPLSATGSTGSGTVRILKVRPIGLKATSSGLHTGATQYVDRLFETAIRIWRKACIEIVRLDWHIITNSVLAQTDDYEQIAMSFVDPDPKVIEVFFVDRVLQLLQSFTGGTTFQGNHALARIVIIGKDPHDLGFPSNDSLLAHELGHVLSGCHPGTQKSGWWSANQGTILEDGLAFWPQPERNTAHNCLMAFNPALDSETQQTCSMQPDL